MNNFMLNDVYVFALICGVLNIVLLAQVASLFFVQYRKSKEPLSFLLCFCFFAFCGSSVFYFLRFFVSPETFFYRIEISLRFAALMSFIYMYERQVKKRKFIYLTLYCILCILLLLFLPYELAYNSGFTIYVAALIVLWFFLRVYRETDGRIHINIRNSFIGAFIWGVGIGFSADLMVQTIGEVFIAIGLIISLIGLIMIGISFYNIRTTDEFLWYNEAQSLFIIYKSLCIYAYSIDKDEILKEADLHGGGLASVLIVAQSIVKSQEPPEHIAFQNMNFLVQIGQKNFTEDRLTAVLITKKPLSILSEKLQTFVHKFEEKFQNTLMNWNGNTLLFTENIGELIQIFRLRR